MRKSAMRVFACSLVAVMTFATIAPVKTARAESSIPAAEAGAESGVLSVSAAKENTLYLTADMAYGREDGKEIIVSGESWERIVVPKEIGAVRVIFDGVEVGELVVESGSTASVLLRATTAAKVTVEEPKLKEIDWTELRQLLADAQTSQKAIEQYTQVQEENARYSRQSPRITTDKETVINSLTAGAGVSLNLKNGEVGSLNVKTGEKLTRAEIAVEGYHGDIAYTGSDSFGVVSLKLKNSEVGRLTVSESCGSNYLLVNGNNSFADNIDVAGNANVSLNIPADALTVTADAESACVDVLNKVDNMTVAANNAKVEIAPIGSVASAEVSGNKVSIGGSGTLGEVDIIGKSASVSTNGTTVKGENTYVAPSYTAPSAPVPTPTKTPTVTPETTPTVTPETTLTVTPETTLTVTPETTPTVTPETTPTVTPETTPTVTPETTPTVTPTPKPTFVSWEDAGLEDHVMDWKDAALEAAMREITGITSGDIMLSDVWEKKGLDLSRKGIVNINALAELTNLTNLDLADNLVFSDISALAGLTNLTNLNLSWTNISDISAVAGLTNLTNLDLAHNNGIRGINNEISDISALAELTNLTNLNLSSTAISDISALAGLTNLTNLDLANNNGISDIRALAKLTNLTNLNLSSTAISDISALAELTNLTDLYLSGIQISDISALAGLTNLTYLDLSWNAISDISVLEKLTKLKWLRLLGNDISDIGALSELWELRYVNLSGNNISNISALSKLSLDELYYSTFVKWEDAGLKDHEMIWEDSALEEGMRMITGIHDRPIMLSDVWEKKSLYLYRGLLFRNSYDNNNYSVNISALSELTNLIELTLFDFAILDINALSRLKNLNKLVLYNNSINDITALSGLKNLEMVQLTRNPIADYSPVDHVKNVYK